jgi:hypothetical protein
MRLESVEIGEEVRQASVNLLPRKNITISGACL